MSIDSPVAVSLSLKLAVMHREPHLDEAVATVLLGELYPEMYFDCQDEAEAIITYGKDPEVALVGIGGGQFDEHKADGRLPGECATTLVARAFNFAGEPQYQVLLADVLRNDTETTRFLDWGNVVKTLHGWSNYGPERVHNWIKSIVRAHLAEQQVVTPRLPTGNLALRREVIESVELCEAEGRRPYVNTVVVPAYADFGTILKLWLFLKLGYRLWRSEGEPEVVFVDEHDLAMIDGTSGTVFIGIEGGQFPPAMRPHQMLNFFGVSRAKDPLVYGRIHHLIGEYERQLAHPMPFDLLNCVRLLNGFCPFDAESLATTVLDILEAYGGQAAEFNERCPEDFRARGKCNTVGNLKFAMVESDLRRMSVWCRSGHGGPEADVVLVRRSNHNVAILCDTSHKAAMWYIAEEIAKAEAKMAGWQRDRFERWFAADFQTIVLNRRGRELPEPISHWYFFIEAGQCLNGSFSHDAPPTRLSNADLRKAVERGLKQYLHLD